MQKAVDKVASFTAELNTLLDLRGRLTLQRDSCQCPDEERVLNERIAEINSTQIRDLQKRIHDAFNAAKRHSDRKSFKALEGRIRGSLSGIENVRESNISPQHESRLLEALHRAKTNSERRRIGRGLRQLRRDRSESSMLQSKVSATSQ